jgi:SatD family protein
MARGWWKVLIADLKSSRKLAPNDRRQVDQAMERAISRVVKAHGEHFRLTPEVLRGDELQAVLRPAAPALAILTSLRAHLMLGAENVEGLRAGLGLGSLLRVSPKGPFASEGEAFHRAREALESVKQRGSSRMTGWRSGDSAYDQSADVVLGLLDAIGARWTRPQWEAILGRLEGKGLHVIGKEKGVKFQNVSKRLRAASWNEVQAAIDHLDFTSLALSAKTANEQHPRRLPRKGENRSSPSRG